MASRKLLREKFEALQSEAERVRFCAHYLLQDLWDRDDIQKGILPENYPEVAIENMQNALGDVGRTYLWEKFGRAVLRYSKNVQKGKPKADEEFLRDLLGEFY